MAQVITDSPSVASSLLDGVDWPASSHQRWPRWAYLPVLALLLALYTTLIFSYWVPAHSGVDQNGYLVTARLISEQHRIYNQPENPWQFAGRMCIVKDWQTQSDGTLKVGEVYAKYPVGFPLLAAVGRWLAGPEGMYWINPLGTILAAGLSFFLFRQLVSDFAALLGVVWLMLNPVVLYWANNPNSHASSLFCVVFGFWGLLSWWRTGSLWRGLLGAFAIGYACTIRYTEFLLILPVVMVVIGQLRKQAWRWMSGGLVLLAWALPVTVLAVICWIHFGKPWTTGYTYCNEDTGFGWKYFIGSSDPDDLKIGNWETFIQAMNRTGLFFLWPLGVVGMLGLLAYSFRMACAIFLWIVPSAALYMTYYWAPSGETSFGYLRFFVTLLPGLILCGLWLMEQALHRLPSSSQAGGISGWWRRNLLGKLGRPLAMGLVTAVALLINADLGISQMVQQEYRSAALRSNLGNITAQVPAGAVLFADDQFCNMLDAVAHYRLYSTNLFTPRAFESYYDIFNRRDPDRDGNEEPNPLQFARAELYTNLLGRQVDNDTWQARPRMEIESAFNGLVALHLQRGQDVWIVLRDDAKGALPRDTRQWTWNEMAKWSPIAGAPPPQRATTNRMNRPPIVGPRGARPVDRPRGAPPNTNPVKYVLYQAKLTTLAKPETLNILAQTVLNWKSGSLVAATLPATAPASSQPTIPPATLPAFDATTPPSLLGRNHPMAEIFVGERALGIEKKAELQYAQPDGKPVTLDLYRPVKFTGKLPLVLWIHGGGWEVGSKDKPQTTFLVRNGFAVASVQYRLSGRSIWPAQIQDVKSAVRWLRLHADEYQLDPERFGVWGLSSGGHLATMLALARKAPEFDTPDNAGASDAVQAVCDWFGPTDFALFGPEFMAMPGTSVTRLLGDLPSRVPKQVQSVNPLNYLGQGPIPPFLIMHGQSDPVVNIVHSQKLAQELTTRKASVRLIEIPQGGHGFVDREHFETVLKFFISTLRPNPPATRPVPPVGGV